MILKEKYEKVITRTDGNIRYFMLIENERFIDINNLDKYTVKQLKSISETIIRGAKKQHYIDYILRVKSGKIIEQNRDIKLKELFEMN